MHLQRLVLGALAVLFTATGTHAATIFTANLTHSQESTQGPFLTATGDPRPESFGTATLMLNDAQTALTFTALIYNIDVTGTQTEDTNDNLRSAHIHAPAPPGQNAGVVWGFVGAPFNDTNPNDTLLTPFASGVGGTFTSKWDLPEGNNTTLAAQVPNLLAGLAYLNFHTVQFTGGEIRGQILPAAAVPEPGSMFLLTLGLAGLAAQRRSRAVRVTARTPRV